MRLRTDPTQEDTARLEEALHMVADWIMDEAPLYEPDDLLSATLWRTSRTRRRAPWRNPERWFPMAIALRPAAVVSRGVLYLALLALLLAIVTSAFLLAGDSPSVPITPMVENALFAQGIQTSPTPSVPSSS